jgi:hypothetical protein
VTVLNNEVSLDHLLSKRTKNCSFDSREACWPCSHTLFAVLCSISFGRLGSMSQTFVPSVMWGGQPRAGLLDTLGRRCVQGPPVCSNTAIVASFHGGLDYMSLGVQPC